MLKNFTDRRRATGGDVRGLVKMIDVFIDGVFSHQISIKVIHTLDEIRGAGKNLEVLFLALGDPFCE